MNAEDPKRVDVGGEVVAAELLYARRMTEWLERLEPEPSEALRLAVRAQHLCRWKIPRSDYPDGRAGYKRWRSDLARLHATLASEILREVGYDDDSVDRVAAMLQKRNLRTDPEVQILEDTACLVFLVFYFEDFATKHDEEKLVDILRKTWKKMSDRGRRAALALDLPPHLQALVTRALS